MEKVKDTIYRQAAIDAIANCTNCGDEKTLRAYVAKHNLDNGWSGGVLEAIDAIEDLPSAQQWIPVAERLPQKEVDVLCCRDNKTMAIMHFSPVLTTRYPKWFSVVKGAFSWRQDNVIAWMPLPEPYTERREE